MNTTQNMSGSSTTPRLITAALLALFLLPGLSACGDDTSGSGSLTVTTWGEDYIEKGIPATAVEDGYAITYSRFLVAFSDIRIEDAGGALGGEAKAPRVFDLTHRFGARTIDIEPLSSMEIRDLLLFRIYEQGASWLRNERIDLEPVEEAEVDTEQEAI